jgi:rhomboid protease GluP
MCPHCRAFITIHDKVCPYCDNSVGPRASDLRGREHYVGGILPSAQFVTSIILTINVGLYLVTTIASLKSGNGSFFDVDGMTLVRYGALWPQGVRGGQWWRLLTAGFLHGGVMHILFNSWALMDVGAHTEQIYGPRRMAAIYLLSTIGGFAASLYWTRTLSVGASAGLFGLIGAMIAVGVLHKSFEAAAIKEFYIRWAIYGLLMGLLPFFQIDNAAHVGGLFTGFVTAWLSGTSTPSTKFQEALWGGIAALLTLLTGYAFVKLLIWVLATGSMF